MSLSRPPANAWFRKAWAIGRTCSARRARALARFQL